MHTASCNDWITQLQKMKTLLLLRLFLKLSIMSLPKLTLFLTQCSVFFNLKQY